MSVTSQSSGGDPIWTALRAETWSEQERDSYLRQYLTTIILKSKRLEESLGMILSARLKTECLIPELLHSLVNQAFAQPGAGETVRRDLQAMRDGDPESDGYLVPFLFMRGFQALQCYRVSHWLWSQGRELLAYHLQSRTSEVFGADIHPAARIGAGIMMDHATGIVIGRSVIGDDVTIGAGSIIASNLEIGSGARIAPGSAVMESVLPNTLVSGVPAVHQTDDDRATLIL
jgi:serine O-acetyltransferase